MVVISLYLSLYLSPSHPQFLSLSLFFSHSLNLFLFLHHTLSLSFTLSHSLTIQPYLSIYPILFISLSPLPSHSPPLFLTPSPPHPRYTGGLQTGPPARATMAAGAQMLDNVELVDVVDATLVSHTDGTPIS